MTPIKILISIVSSYVVSYLAYKIGNKLPEWCSIPTAVSLAVMFIAFNCWLWFVWK